MKDEIMVAHSEYMEVSRMVRALADENASLRATNQRLNRRCQLAESAALQNVDACKRAGVPFGRVLAHFHFEDVKRRILEVLA